MKKILSKQDYLKICKKIQTHNHTQRLRYHCTHLVKNINGKNENKHNNDAVTLGYDLFVSMKQFIS